MRTTLRTSTLLVLVAGLLLTLLLAGCATTSREKLAKEFPDTVEAVVEAAPPHPDRIEYIDVRPWAPKPGDTVTIQLRATAGRTAEVALEGIDGKASGTKRTISLEEGKDGLYSGSLAIGEDLPPGRYRVTAVLTGGPSGKPVTLASSRALVVTVPPPKPDPCAVAAKKLSVPRVHFAFDRYDLDEQDLAWIRQVAATLRELGDRVARVTIEGHCDERGTTEYNLALGAKRARAVADALRAEPGMDGLVIETVSKGEEEPLVPHARTEEEHAKNRRAVFVLECRPAR